MRTRLDYTVLVSDKGDGTGYTTAGKFAREDHALLFARTVANRCVQVWKDWNNRSKSPTAIFGRAS